MLEHCSFSSIGSFRFHWVSLWIAVLNPFFLWRVKTMSEETTTYAEIMASNLQKIADSLNELLSMPLPKELILLYVQKRTRLPKKDIEAVFDAIEELNKKVKKKS